MPTDEDAIDDDDDAPPSARGWDADSYHRIALPQTAWGIRVLGRLDLTGTETVLDAGCGTGKLTASLCARLPRGRVIAVDSSADMLRVAKTTLAQYADRVSFMHADLSALSLDNACDVVFSTATFHWLRDHEQLFANLFRALVRGGRLHAQCGGGANLTGTYARAEAVMKRPELAQYFTDWQDPTYFSTAEDASTRLLKVGFIDVNTDLEDAPTAFPDRESYRAFLEKVIFTAHLERLPDAAKRALFLDALADEAEAAETPFLLDYVRLNLRATKP